MINWENYEEYLVMHADGELQPAEEQELMAFIEANPQLESELAMWERTKLPLDGTLAYPDKDALLRPESASRTIALPLWVRYAAAACIAAIIFSTVYKFSGRSGVTKITAFRDVPQSAPARAIEPAKTGPDTAIAAVVKTSDGDVTPVRHKKSVLPKNPGTIKKQLQEGQVVVLGPQPLALPVAEMKTVACNNGALTLSPAKAPAIPAPVVEEEERRSFWDWLPMEDDKKKRLENIADAVAGVYSGDKPETGKKVNIKMQNRKIRVIF